MPNEKYIKAFLKELNFKCFLEAINLIRGSTVQAEAAILADKKKWTDAELAILTTTRLDECEYLIPGGALFQIRNTRTKQAVSFSDRISTAGELRGELLRNAIDEVKAISPKLSLHDAINLALQDPNKSPFLSYYINAYGQGLDLKEREKHKPLIKAAIGSLITMCLGLINAAEKRGEREKIEKELEKAWPVMIQFLHTMDPRKIRSKCALIDPWVAEATRILSTTVDSLADEDLRKAAAKHLLEKVAKIKKQYPHDAAILDQVLWQTQLVITQPLNKQIQEEYLKLSQEMSKNYPWGKIVAGAMLGVIFATTFAMCCAATGGAAFALPLLAIGIHYLLTIAAVSLVSTVFSLGFFAKGLQEKSKLDDFSKAMTTLTPQKP